MEIREKWLDRNWRRAGRLFGVGLLAGLLLAAASYGLGRWLRSAAWSEGAAQLHGKTVEPARPAVGFTLAGSDGREHSLAAFRGQAVLLYFGYTRCTVDCPAALAKMAQARQGVGDASSQVQVLFITIDPEHDTPEKLAGYLAAYGAGFLGLRGAEVDLQEIALNYEVTLTDTAAHTPTILLIDPQGFWRAVYLSDTTADEITADLEMVLGENR